MDYLSPSESISWIVSSFSVPQVRFPLTNPSLSLVCHAESFSSDVFSACDRSVFPGVTVFNEAWIRNVVQVSEFFDVLSSFWIVWISHVEHRSLAERSLWFPPLLLFESCDDCWSSELFFSCES